MVFLQPTDQNEQHRLAEDIGNFIEHRSDADKSGLLLVRQGFHVIAVRRYIVCGRAESRDSEENKFDGELAFRG